MRRTLRVGILGIVCLAAAGAGAHDKAGHGPGAANSAPKGPSAGYAFALPEPGSYRLPPIKPAGGGTVLDETGRTRQLLELVRGRITVLAFLYTRCGDVCPTATLQMSVLQDLAGQDPFVADRIHLVSMSFDPDHDTPAVMAEHAAHWRSERPGAPAWHFVTAPDQAALAPVLAAYDQAVAAKPEADPTAGPLHHLFRAFLIDSRGAIRNIYSLDFLDPALVLNDARTVLMEEAAVARGEPARPKGLAPRE